MSSGRTSAHEPASHLTPEHWRVVNRRLVRKALAELSHERLLTPTPVGAGRYVVSSDDGRVRYHFEARIGSLLHWSVDADSITRHRDGAELPLDAMELFLELRDTLGLHDGLLPVYLEEISSTLESDAFKLAKPRVSSGELLDAGFQAIESGMTEGHPCFLANSGRIGFDITESAKYAPEAGAPLRLVWLAAHRDRVGFSASAGLDYDELVRSELDQSTRERFEERIREFGLDPADYLFVPVHPWQWDNKLPVTFAAEFANRNLVHLGSGDDDYLPQQSIRTFFNSSSPERHYVKTAISVLNMGFLRGLSPEYMRATPAINDWVSELIFGDELLRESGFDILRELAAVGYHNEYYTAAAKDSPYRKMLAALWRESPVPKLRDGQRAATMASLLHVDEFGEPLVGTLISRSGLAPADWLRRYLDAYLRPLLHCFYAYGVVFMPHGENIILVLEDGVPNRVLLKDIGEEVAVIEPETELPAEIERIRSEVPENLRALSLFTDVFDCFFRFLCSITHEHGLLDERDFWRTVAECVADYEADAPELRERFRKYDLFAERYELSCLNRLQLGNNQQMVNLQDPASALKIAGTLDNPIAPHAPTRD
ncbi:IucA/IucC family siderophore biosynthesis protein [Actinopolyspora erythraea]|uniref:IucA/IucC family siderophore biosynthesis protein n=1 Tax=Actinopolyspora erythraea TaxID=414996 RepID=A0A223RXP2_9ACTN|nr:IucA/IucC family siderophore biosynthesis protein [Actinopolyspora erythraea]ASU80509.1 IucA/IucC family siderophore biosynthesis protein [Actinopolyspora erythraea]